ncbi:hypothetical protein M5K25_014221 [Dendrobium thyrsiflorum]|uniref:Cyclin-D-binding Myb-like transcription factor 1 n=1 Tax=Dendrobium thyrsiflorum TaxID=117978 RepID=A0ABD0V245_DENTH
MSCSENRATDGGFKEVRKYKDEHKKEKKKRNQKGITDFNSLKNASDEEGANLEDEIIHGGPMQIEKGKKRPKKKKRNYKENENSTPFTENCNWDEDKEQDKKRKRECYFLEHELDQGSSKKTAKDASKKAYKVISGGNAQEVLSRTHISNKDKKKEKEKEYLASCTELTLAMTTRKEKGDQRSTASTTNNFEKSKSDMNTLNTGKGCSTNESYNCELKKDTKIGEKKVSFSDKVEEFPAAQFINEKLGPDNFVWGKRFTPEEDELIRKATMDYIEDNQLGEQGLHMILHCGRYRREVKGCWKVIGIFYCGGFIEIFRGAALPWRPTTNVILRAHIIFERSEVRKWEPEELELIKRYHAEHGPKWKKLAEMLGKSRLHVKDTWRRIRLPNLKRGAWSQDEYQSLFDLVNMDLRMKSFEDKKNNHWILKDNISWEAISNKMSTRGAQLCCMKWYSTLASSMIKEGNWSDLDDYKLIEALQEADACCIEDVDWDSLLEQRSGKTCQKRWYEMIRHLDKFWAMTFVEQVDLLSERYSPDMIEYREMSQKEKSKVDIQEELKE